MNNFNVLFIYFFLQSVPIKTKSLIISNFLQNGGLSINPDFHLTSTSVDKSLYLNKSLDLFEIIQTPNIYFRDAAVLIKFRCSRPSIIGVEVRINTLTQENITVFKHLIICKQLNYTYLKSVKLKLPSYLIYRPDYFNQYSVYSDKAKINLWMLYKDQHENVNILNRNFNFYYETELDFQKPLERPSKPLEFCLNLYYYINKLCHHYNPTCAKEIEIDTPVLFPVALSGFSTGIHRKYEVYKNKILEKLRNESLPNPEFTFVIWIYVYEYCNSYKETCSILQHITWDDNYASPQLLLNSYGQLFLELVLEDGRSIKTLTSNSDTIPLKIWTRLILNCSPKQCNMTAEYTKENIYQKWTLTVNIKDDEIFYFDDAVGLIVFGGSEMHSSFKGYIGKTIYYRRKNVQLQEVDYENDLNKMLKYKLTEVINRCKSVIDKANYLISHVHNNYNKLTKKKMCKPVSKQWLEFAFDREKYDFPICLNKKILKELNFEEFYDIITDNIFNDYLFTLEDIGFEFADRIDRIIELNDIEDMADIAPLLEMSSCLGNQDSTFMYSVLLNYGFIVPSNEALSLSYLMHGALHGNRLCLLTLGNKHIFGLDGHTTDYEQAYVYFKSVADMTKQDLETHKSNDVYTEMVRLTNDFEIEEQTEEDGEMYVWLKHQAGQGILNAQQNLARMLYWGSKGVTRNVAAAVNYYRLAAESGNPSALYDYGIVLLKGHGIEKNITLAIEVLTKAADQEYPQALNTLGWHAMEVERNFSKAAKFFHRSHNAGNKDASYNLAHMYLHGKYPNSPIDKIKAWEFLASGALRGQLESGILVGMYNMRGHPSIVRNLTLAIGWIRYVAELNPGIGKILSKGVRAFKNQNWLSSVMYYMMGASTGVEVANFNLAYLCDENAGDFVKYIEKDCKWRHFNLSTQRIQREENVYAWVKMAEFHYKHGFKGNGNPYEAIYYYLMAALKNDPQGFFYLANIVEDGVNVPSKIWEQLGLTDSVIKSNYSILIELYTRCLESQSEEAYLPCVFSLYRVMFTNYYQSICSFLLKIWINGIFVLISIAVLFYSYKLYQRLNRNFNEGLLAD